MGMNDRANTCLEILTYMQIEIPQVSRNISYTLWILSFEVVLARLIELCFLQTEYLAFN